MKAAKEEFCFWSCPETADPKAKDVWNATATHDGETLYDLEITCANRRSIKIVAEMFQELQSLVERCDGPEGVRADGSNIDTSRAHAALAKAKGETK